MSTWPRDIAGVLSLPSGRLVRGRALHRPVTDGLRPDFGLYLLDDPPDPLPWQSRWVHWPDFGLPRDRHDASDALHDAWCRAEHERVEVACLGGRGRTGTALACLAILDGIPAEQAVAYVREHYDGQAVETLRQRRFAARFNRG